MQTGPSEVTLSWQPVAGALGYGVIGPGAAPQAPLPFAGVTATTMTVTSVPPGSQQWSVGSLYPHQGPQGAFEPPIDFSPVADFTKVTLNVVVAPKINPSGLTAVQTGPSEVTLSWQSVAGALAYGVTGPGASPQYPLPFAAVTATTMTVTNVPPGSQQWSVGTLYPPPQGAQGAFAPPVDATPVADFTKVTLNVVVAPKINPSGLTAVQTGPGQVTLSWQPVAGVLGYGVIGPGAAPQPPLSLATVTATTMTVMNVPAGNQQWSVGSLYSPPQGAQGVFAPPVDATPVADFTKVTLNVIVPPKINPSGLTAVQTGPSEVTLSWQPVAGALAYGVIGPGAAPQAPLPFAAVTATTMTVTNVPPGSQQWSVGTLYPLPQGAQGVFAPPVDATPVADFTKVTLTVTIRAGGGRPKE